MRTAITAILALVFLSVGLRPAAAEQTVLSEQEIKDVVRRHAHEISRCYKRHALKQKRARGKVQLGMVVSRDGTVRRKTIAVKAPGVRGKKFARCVKRKVRNWQFPESRWATEVRYPFFFQHARRYR